MILPGQDNPATESRLTSSSLEGRRRLVDGAVILLIVLFAGFFGALAVQQHRTFQTNGLDLGNVDQALWNTAQGRFLHFTLMAPVQSRLALHVEPILLLFVPLYWLNLGRPETLLMIQAAIVAVGAWPVYQLSIINFQLSKTFRLSPPSFLFSPTPFILLIFPLVYLLWPTLEAAVLYDFHAVTLAPTFLLFAFWALVRQKDGWFIGFALLALACKEDMALVVAMMGLYAGLAQHRWRLAGLVIGLSLAWFVIAVMVIQPRFAAGGNIQLDRYAWLGNTPLEIITTGITHPGLVFEHLWNQVDLVSYLTALFWPTAFLALFSPLTLLPLLPTLAVNLLSDNPFTWRLEDFHYGAPLAPFLMISTIYGIKRIVTWLDRPNQPPFGCNQLTTPLFVSLAILLLLFTGTYHYYRGFTPLARPYHWSQITDHHQQTAALLPTIPPDTPLFTQSNLAPHLTHRQTVYSDFAYFTDPDFPALPVEDILLDVTSFENLGGLHQFLQQTLLASGDYQLVTAQDGLLHLRPLTADRRELTQPDDTQLPISTQSAQSPNLQLPSPFYTFTQPTIPPDHQLAVDFGDAVRLHGYSLYFNRQEEVQVSVDLEARQPLNDLWPVLYLLDETGQPVGATVDLQPALVWFPPAQWPVGQPVRLHFNTLPWYTRETAAYRLALGLVSGDDVWAVEQRPRPVVRQAGPYASRLPSDGTLLELARFNQVWNMPEGGPMRRQFAAPPPPYKLAANFANQIKLLGTTTPRLDLPPQSPNLQPTGQSAPHLSLTLTWQALTTPETLIRFVQLVGPDGRVYGQNDSNPDEGNYPTRLWQPGEVVVETVTFPLQTGRPSGQYTLHVGLYRPETGQRLPLLAGGDHVEIPGPFFKAQ